MGHGVTIPDILRFGASYLKVKKLPINFGSKVFMQGALFSYPEKIQIAPIWDNPLITQNNRAIKKSVFPTLSGKLITVSDVFRPGTGTLLTKAELERGFDIEVTEEDLIEMHFIIKQSRRNLGLNDNDAISTCYPFQPLLINIANMTKKGCNFYYRLLHKNINLRTSLAKQETKWHNELNCIYEPTFWNKTYALAANIKNESKIKYL